MEFLAGNRIRGLSSDRLTIITFGLDSTVTTSTSDADSIAVDSNGNVWVSSSVLKTVKKYNSSGVYQNISISAFTSGQSLSPIAIDSNDNIWIGEYETRITKQYNSSGTYLQTLPAFGSGSNRLAAMHIDSNDNMFIADATAGNIYVYNSSQVLQFSFNAFTTSPHTFVGGVTTDPSGNIYATNYYSTNVKKFSSTGTYLSSFASGLTLGYHLHFDSNDELWVSDANDSVIDRYDVNGSSLGTFTSNGTSSSFDDKNNKLYITNRSTNGYKVYTLASTTNELPNVEDGSVFYETDTNKSYVLNSGTWTEL